MPRFAQPMILVSILVLAGCQAKDSMAAREASMDTALVRAVHQPEVNNAIVAQHTLYPYHFDDGATSLNGLGRRDLGVLAGHFKTTSGELNVRKGAASRALYEARVKAVLAGLTEAGVDAGHVSVADELPGGDGLASAEVVVKIEATRKSSAAAAVAPAMSQASQATKSGANR